MSEQCVQWNRETHGKISSSFNTCNVRKEKWDTEDNKSSRKEQHENLFANESEDVKELYTCTSEAGP